MDSHPLFRWLKGLTETMLDWAEWSRVAAVIGALVIVAAVVVACRLPAANRRRAALRGALGAALGFVGLAVLATVAGVLLNLALMHLGGHDHVRHFHPRLIRQAAMIGAALGAGGGALAGVLHARWRGRSH
jgi:hypothetical protein